MADDIEEIRQQKREELRARIEGGEQDADAGAGTDGDARNGPDEPVHVSGQGELNALVSEHGVVLADFYADWCGPCQMLEPVVERIADETDAAVAKVDVDANQRLAQSYGVRGVPTLVLFADGQQVETLVGVQDEARLRSLVASHAG